MVAFVTPLSFTRMVQKNLNVTPVPSPALPVKGLLIITKCIAPTPNVPLTVQTLILVPHASNPLTNPGYPPSSLLGGVTPPTSNSQPSIIDSQQSVNQLFQSAVSQNSDIDVHREDRMFNIENGPGNANEDPLFPNSTLRNPDAPSPAHEFEAVFRHVNQFLH